MTGPLGTPRIWEREKDAMPGRYLALLADQARQAQDAGASALRAAPEYRQIASRAPSNALRQTLGFGAVFVLFFLTLLLAGQTVSSLAEEKSNKVIEILAAAAPLEAVFVGKLVGFLGVALLFISFWVGLGAVAALVAAGTMAGASTGAAASDAQAAAVLLQTAPATGWGFFIAVGFAYFIMAFLLLGAIFLGIGSQAAHGARNSDAVIADHDFSGRHVRLCLSGVEHPGQSAGTHGRGLSLFLALCNGRARRDRPRPHRPCRGAGVAIIVGRRRRLAGRAVVPQRRAERAVELGLLEARAASLTYLSIVAFCN